MSNLAHRLLKNHISEATSWRAYILFTEPSLAHLGVSLPEAHAQTETYEHLGEVQTYSLNLHPRYQALTNSRRVFVTVEEADLVLAQIIGAPAPVVWDWLNDPQKRTRWMHSRFFFFFFFFFFFEAANNRSKTRMVETIQLETLPDGRTRMSDRIKLEMDQLHWLKRPVIRHLITRGVQYKSDEIHAGLARMIEAELGETPVPPGAASAASP